MAGPVAAVLVKSVPVGGRFLRAGNDRLERDGIPHGLDPANEVALEWAVRARESGVVGRVVAVTMGPAPAADALRRAIAMGADEGVLISDPALVGADVRATAIVLGAAVRRLSPSLVLLGNESADGSSGAVPAAVATLLDWPLLSLARTASLADRSIACRRDLGQGVETVEADLPAVVSFVAGGIEPRYPKVKEVLRARTAPLGRLGLAELGLPHPAAPAERVVGLERVPEAPRSMVTLRAREGVEAILRRLLEAPRE